MGTWCLLGECLAENSAWQPFFLPHAGIHHGKLRVRVWGGLAHLPSLLEALNFERERDFLMGFPLQSINQLQRNTSETRNGLLAGGVMTKALPPHHFVSFVPATALVRIWGLPEVDLPVDPRSQGGDRKEKSAQRSRDNPRLWPLSVSLLHDVWLSANR